MPMTRHSLFGERLTLDLLRLAKFCVPVGAGYRHWPLSTLRKGHPAPLKAYLCEQL